MPRERSEDARLTACRTVKASYRQQVLALNAYPPRLNPTALLRKKPLSQSILSTSPIRRASSPWRLTKGTVFSLVFPFSPVNRPVNFSFPAFLTAHLFSNRLWPYFMLVLITFICPDRRLQRVCGKTPPDAMRPAVNYSVMQFSFRLLWARCFVPVPFDAAHPRYVFG